MDKDGPMVVLLICACNGSWEYNAPRIMNLNPNLNYNYIGLPESPYNLHTKFGV